MNLWQRILGYMKCWTNDSFVTGLKIVLRLFVNWAPVIMDSVLSSEAV